MDKLRDKCSCDITVVFCVHCVCHFCVYMYVCVYVKGFSERDLPTFDELSGDEDLSVDEALRLGLTPLDLNDIWQLSDDWVADAAEEQLRLDHHVASTNNHYS